MSNTKGGANRQRTLSGRRLIGQSMEKVFINERREEPWPRERKGVRVKPGRGEIS